MNTILPINASEAAQLVKTTKEREMFEYIRSAASRGNCTTTFEPRDLTSALVDRLTTDGFDVRLVTEQAGLGYRPLPYYVVSWEKEVDRLNKQ